MNQIYGLLRAMTSNDVSVAMGRRIELDKGHPAVGGGWLEVTAAPLRGRRQTTTWRCSIERA
jgi:hypothetical protein